jgi:hypothetical protein
MGAQSYGSADAASADCQTAEWLNRRSFYFLQGGIYPKSAESVLLFSASHRFQVQFIILRSSMKKKTFMLLSALLIAILITSTAGAAGSIKLRSVSWSLETQSGSTTASALRITESFPALVATGFASGLGKMDVTIRIEASGIPDIVCTNNGENDVPGQSSPKVTASGDTTLLGNDPIRKNGRSPFGAATENPTTIPWDEAGCPNPNWIAQITFISWTHATLRAYDTATGTSLIEPPLEYNCVTKKVPLSVKCDPAN